MRTRTHLPANRRRSWTDEDLRAAVASHHSWRAVARALGLCATSTNNLRRHVTRLRLDTSHFRGRRRWSDQQLRDAVAQASSWAEVLVLLNATGNGESRVRVKGHAVRLGIDTSHLQQSWPGRPSTGTAVTTPPRPQQALLRNAAPAIAIAWFALRGYDTALPTEPKEYDLLVTMPAGVRRVQVKSGTRRSSSGRWQVSVGHRPYSLDKAASRAPYDPDSVDFFFLVDGGGGLYLVPGPVLAGRLEVSIDSYPEYRVGDASSLLG